MKFANATNFNRKSGEAEGSAVEYFGPNEFVIPTGANPEIRVSAVEGPAVPSTCIHLDREPRLLIGSS
jgi:hypothetical protein